MHDLRAGDILLWQDHGLTDRLIRFAQARRPSLRPDSVYTHCAVMVNDSGSLVEAVFPKVRRRLITLADLDGLTIIHLALTDAQRAAVSSAAEGYVSEEYGVMDVINFGSMLVFGRQLPFRDTDSVWCSQLVVTCLRAAGLCADLDPWQTSPASLAGSFHVTA